MSFLLGQQLVDVLIAEGLPTEVERARGLGEDTFAHR